LRSVADPFLGTNVSSTMSLRPGRSCDLASRGISPRVSLCLPAVTGIHHKLSVGRE
jgi:hypothetical protein